MNRIEGTEEKELRLIDGNVTIEWILNKEKWKGLQVVVQMFN